MYCSNCFVCGNFFHKVGQFFLCENKHVIRKHKSCKIKYLNCTLCEAKLIGYSNYGIIDNNNMNKCTINFNRKFPKPKYKKFNITENILINTLRKYLGNDYQNFYWKLELIKSRMETDNIHFENEKDFDDYIFFILNKPN